jgi:D-arabinose 1-dehydrogenase-like Zn-dependent alcohol dehydrogenase
MGDGMRAAVVEALGRPLIVRDVADPVCPPDGVVVRVGANGICRTDWALWDGMFWDGGPTLSLPWVLGHEFAGTIVEVGPAVRGWKVGQRVTYPMNPGDGTCTVCRTGQHQVCEHFAEMVPGVSFWGSFAELVAVRHADVNLVELPDTLDFASAAALGCRYIAAFHGVVDQARVRGGEWVVVHGAGGGMGLSAVQVAAAVGASVIAVDIGPEKLALACAAGAVATIDAGEADVAEAVVDMTRGGAQVSIDAVGLAETCRTSIESLRIRGRHLQLGHTTPAEGGVVALPIDVMMIKELEFVSAFGMAAHSFDTMLAMIANRRLDPGALITQRVPLEHAGGVLAGMRDFGTAGLVVIDQFATT